MADYCRVYGVIRFTSPTPGSAPGPTLGNEYGKTLPLPFIKREQSEICSLTVGCGLESRQLAVGAVDRRVEGLDSDLVAREFLEFREHIDTG